MAEKKGTGNRKRRTQVKDLPKKEKELSAEEQKNVKGGQWLTSPAGSAKSATGAGALSGGVDATRPSEESISGKYGIEMDNASRVNKIE